jgi:flagellar protein FlgJ
MPGPVALNSKHQSLTSVQKQSAPNSDDKAVKKACEDFESLLVHQMLKQMRQSVPQNGLFSGGAAEQIYHSMLDGEMAKEISHRKGIGLAPILYQQIKSMTDKTEQTEQHTLKSGQNMPID